MIQRSTRQTFEEDRSPLNDTADGEAVTELIQSGQSDGITEQTRASLQDQALANICSKHKINNTMADKLLKLKKFEIVVVIDDSGSMDTRIKGKRCSRWDELREIVKTVVEIAIIFDTNGVDVHFLNSPEILKVKDARTIDRIFERTPCGFTPTVSTLTKIFKSNLAKEGRDKNLLVFVATDGEPTDDNGNDDFVRFEKVMKETRNQETTFVSFLLCTDVPKYADLFQHYDASMKNVDVVDDYETEKAQVRRRMGPNYPFEHGDYVVKALVGSILTDLDKIDDPLFSK